MPDNCKVTASVTLVSQKENIIFMNCDFSKQFNFSDAGFNITCLLEGLNPDMFAVNCPNSEGVLPFISKLLSFLLPLVIGLGKLDAF